MLRQNTFLLLSLVGDLNKPFFFLLFELNGDSFFSEVKIISEESFAVSTVAPFELTGSAIFSPVVSSAGSLSALGELFSAY